VATHDYSLANATGAQFRSDLNNALAAIASNNSNATDPATTFAFQWYVDTGDNKLKIRNGANNAYIDVGDVTAANLGLAPLAGATFTGTVNGTSFVGSGNSSIGGRLLINTTTARTDVSTTAQLQLEGTDFGTSTFSIVRNSNDAGRPTFVFGKTRGTSTGAVTAVSNNDSLGVIEFLGSDGTDLNRAAFISAEVDGTPGTDDMPGALTFSTSADGSNSPTERLRINSSGEVIVGGSQNGEIYLGNGTNQRGIFTFDGTGSEFLDIGIKGTQSQYGHIRFNTGTTPTERVRITSTGNVSIQNDSGKFTAGAGDDLLLYHDGSQSYIAGDDIRITNKAVSETMAKFLADGTVELNHNDSKKFETTSTGITVTGIIVDRLGGDIRRAIQSTKTSAYTLVEEDTGRHIYISTGGVTVPNGIFNAGAMVTIVNNSGSNQTITQGSSMTMYNTADATTGNRTLAGRGVCTILFASSSQSYISGAGLS